MKHNLREIADTVLGVARITLSETKAGPLLVALGYENGSVELVLLPEAMSGALAYGSTKSILFEGIRALVRQKHATAVAISTEAWVGKSTPAAAAFPKAEYRRLAGLNDGFDTLMAMGLVERREAIMVAVQDADECLVLTQAFRRKEDGTPVDLEEPEEQRMPQSHYEGRTKMFGVLTEETTR